MINKQRRVYVYDKVFSFIINNNLCTLPLSVQELCNLLNVKLIKLSDIMHQTQLSYENIFSIWGNEDGCVMAYGNGDTVQHKIAYNNYKPLERRRFTICEECMHILLGHTEDSTFNVFKQSYSNATYEGYDEEARIGSGLIICPPQLYYTCPDKIAPRHLCNICKISEPCANTRIKVLNKYRNEIQSHPLYKNLPSVSEYLPQFQNNKYFEVVKDSCEQVIAAGFKKLSTAI